MTVTVTCRWIRRDFSTLTKPAYLQYRRKSYGNGLIEPVSGRLRIGMPVRTDPVRPQRIAKNADTLKMI
jgi:hypothetical protein